MSIWRGDRDNLMAFFLCEQIENLPQPKLHLLQFFGRPTIQTPYELTNVLDQKAPQRPGRKIIQRFFHAKNSFRIHTANQ